jgi:hypothetical protein
MHLAGDPVPLVRHRLFRPLAGQSFAFDPSSLPHRHRLCPDPLDRTFRGRPAELASGRIAWAVAEVAGHCAKMAP